MTTFATADERWAGMGPYYAMFPIAFSNAVVDSFTDPGDVVIDPFAGRASSIFSAAVSGRRGVGVEINPVGWVYGKTKLHPAHRQDVTARLHALVETANGTSTDDVSHLPRFFRACFDRATLRFLTTARRELDWRRSITDRTLMAFILVYLHGKRGQSLSNQMRQSKAMSPDYSVKWWREHNLRPPRIDICDFLQQRIAWRYAKGVPTVTASTLLLGDSSRVLNSVTASISSAKLLFTSPPYSGVTSYHYDQWLRLWLLGFGDHPARDGSFHAGKFESQQRYRALLSDVFGKCSLLMDPAGAVYVRTDARPRTLDITREVLREVFPSWTMRLSRKPMTRHSQTALFGDKSQKPGEIDLILQGPKAGRRVFRMHRR